MLLTFAPSLYFIEHLFITFHSTFCTTIMRFVQDIPHAQFRIGLYAWNSKYIVKIEAGPYEQTYKINEMDMTDPEAVTRLLDEPFLSRVAKRFGEMDTDWQEAGERHDAF